MYLSHKNWSKFHHAKFETHNLDETLIASPRHNHSPKEEIKKLKQNHAKRLGKKTQVKSLERWVIEPPKWWKRESAREIECAKEQNVTVSVFPLFSSKNHHLLTEAIDQTRNNQHYYWEHIKCTFEFEVNRILIIRNMYLYSNILTIRIQIKIHRHSLTNWREREREKNLEGEKELELCEEMEMASIQRLSRMNLKSRIERRESIAQLEIEEIWRRESILDIYLWIVSYFLLVQLLVSS